MDASAQDRLVGFHKTAWMVTGAVASALFLPWLFRRGMFWDGVVYGTAARNLALGIGDPWHPVVTQTFLRHLREHPPLGFWLEAAYFRVLGDHFWVERLYSLTTLVIGGTFLLATWRRLLTNRPDVRNLAWLAVLLWAPYGMWCYRQNMLENTMGMFTALAVYAALRAMEGSGLRMALWTCMCGIAIFAALMSKGPVGLFPAVTPLIVWVSLRGSNRAELRKVLAIEMGIVFVVAIALALVLIPPDARQYLSGYWQQQILSSLQLEREGTRTLWGRLNILLWLARELQIPVAIVAVVTVFSRWKFAVKRELLPVGPMWFCLLTALSGSLPIIISPKQGGHYVAPSWPFYMFALTLWCAPAVLELCARLAQWRRQSHLRYVAMAIFAGTVIFSALSYGTCSRDRPLIELADQLANEVPPHSYVAVASDMWETIETGERLVIHAYLYRTHLISIWADETRPAWNFDCFRLSPPDGSLVASGPPIPTNRGIEWQPLAPR